MRKAAAVAVVTILASVLLDGCMGRVPGSTAENSDASIDTPGPEAPDVETPVNPAQQTNSEPTSPTTANGPGAGSDPGSGGDVDPVRQNKLLGRGINLGNMLEGVTEGDIGFRVQQPYLATIKRAGFDSVRIPIRWSTHAGKTPPYTIDTTFFARVDEVVGWALAQSLAVVINVHHYTELMEDPAGHRDRYLALWEQIAGHFAKMPPSVMFELLNEPNGALNAGAWNEIIPQAIATVRRSNPKRTLIVGPGDWNGIWRLRDLKIPPGERKLIATVHTYNPFNFTHSGAEWMTDGPPAGATWTGSDADKQALRNELQQAAAWSKETGIPIYVGEFGVYNRAEQASRVRWTAFMTSTMTELGFSWAYWEFCAGFGAYDLNASAWRQDLLGAIVK